jgi:predicted lipoprotein with Yx(FWY)xxD motif
MNKKIIWAIVAVVVIAGIYFAMTYRPTTPTQVVETPVTSQQQPATAGPVLKLGTDAKLGSYLTAENGLTLYAFAKDASGISNCSGVCATLWPPYIVPASGARAAVPAITGVIGTLQRTDGTIQLTYKGAPLYFWSKDAKAGDTTGNGFNNVWSIVHP